MLQTALRLGYLVAPQGLVDAFRRARQAMDDHPSIVAQPVVAEFIASGQFAAHVRRMRARYAERQQALIAAATRTLGGLLAVEPNAAGMHLVGHLPKGRNDRAVTRAAFAERICAEMKDAGFQRFCPLNKAIATCKIAIARL